MKKNLLDYDLQLFAEEGEVTGENEVAEAAEPQEDEAEAEAEETGETEGDAEPRQQTAEENAQYAAMRRRAEEEARRKYAPITNQLDQVNQQVVAMCEGITHPVTGRPITNVFEYWDALRAQQQQSNEQELQDKGVDPSLIKRMVASDPTVLQAQQVIQQMQTDQATAQVLKDVEEIGKLDPSIKSVEDLANAPYKDALVEYCQKHGTTLTDAFKVLNFDHSLQHQSEAARQQAINQMRGKSHLSTQSQNLATEDDLTEVPAEIMSRMKEAGKTEKQIKELFKKTVRNGLKFS